MSRNVACVSEDSPPSSPLLKTQRLPNPLLRVLSQSPLPLPPLMSSVAKGSSLCLKEREAGYKCIEKNCGEGDARWN